MSVKKMSFGTMPDGKSVELYRIKNGDIVLEVITFGAILQSLYTPDRDGTLQDITVGFDTLDEHLEYSDNQGKTVGRYANRIGGGRFAIGDRQYSLTLNEKCKTCLHSAGEFSDVVWDCEITGENSITLSHTSPDGTNGFPGTMEAKVTYTVSDDNRVIISFCAKSDRDTVINFTNHTYFNLRGNSTGDVLDHVLKINASHFTPTDADSIPTGEIRSVYSTPFDFTVPHKVGERIYCDCDQLTMCGGYDHNFCLDHVPGEPDVILSEPVSGRTMKIKTDMPGVQLYTGNFLNGTHFGKNLVKLIKHNGLCLETQFYPDTPNRPEFPQCTFRAGEEFCSETEFIFS